MLITKASGEKVEFDRKIYEASLQRVGLTVEEARQIGNEIYQDLHSEISTEKILEKTQKVLKRKNQSIAIKYGLKKAIMRLGPAGYYFEKYMSAVLSAYGYKTKYNQFIYGRCVQHEVDIIAERDREKFMIECKYHTNPGRKSDLKVALYTYARFLDLKDKHNFKEPVLMTNTLCTTEAIRYAKCMGMKIIGWHYPARGESLEHYIESKKLYPVSILGSVNNQINKKFRDGNLFLALDLLKYTPKRLAKKFHLKEHQAVRLIKEAQILQS